MVFWRCPCLYTPVADTGLAVSALLMIGGEATVLSGEEMRPTSNVNIVSILLKDVSMVEIRLSSVTAEMPELAVLVDCLREREAVFS